MRFIVIAQVIFILVFFGSCSKKGDPEKEPNNSFSTANGISHDVRYIGSMATANDRDFFRLELKEAGVLDIHLSGLRGINLALKIWKGDEKPELVKWVDDNRKSSPERMPNLAVVPGDYYLEVFQSDRDPRKSERDNAYELTVTWREAIAEESEPNDNSDHADTLYPGREITGYFSPAYNRLNDAVENLHREEDWFVADVELASDLPLLMDLSISGVTGVNSLVYLYDTERSLIAESDNGGAGEPESITGAGIRKSGSYYIMVAAKGYTVNHDEPYVLKIILNEHDRGGEIEPNNDFDSANACTGTVTTGKINARDDRDIFLCDAEDGPAIYRIELRPPEEMDIMFGLYSAEREKIIDINGGGRGDREVYPNFYSERNFFVSVSARTGDRLPAGEYVLSVTRLDEIAAMEREPNSDTSQANNMSGKSVTGYTSYRGDRDYFIVTCESRIKEKFEIRGVRGGEIKVSITDPLGYIIRTVEVKGESRSIFSEMIDRKGYVIVEAVKENYDYPYTVSLGGVR
ncbi:MAG: hypothetical protein JW807_11825 [Spirochaetes bacterium]|nr:hypothetical protein [Spirochaetota bacterium]